MFGNIVRKQIRTEKKFNINDSNVIVQHICTCEIDTETKINVLYFDS